VDSEATAPDDPAVGHGLGRDTAQPIGALLGTARIARGLELADIARETRVPLRHLAAIEADAHDNLPALPYAIGFVKAFARAVGVDPEMAAARFRGETNKSAHVPVAPAMAPMDERRLPPRGLVTASIAALLAVVALVVAWSTGAFDTAVPAAPPPAPIAAAAAPVVSPVAPTVTPTVAGTPTAPATAGADAPLTAGPATAPVATPAGTAAISAPTGAPVTTGSVVITANEDAWIKVSVFDPAVGKVVAVKTGVLAKSERYVPPPTPGLRLWTGRAGALAITVDGRAVPPLGGPVETVKNVSLDARDLRARLVAPPLPGRAGPPVG
jgi:cytoskeleton protein RodZ